MLISTIVVYYFDIPLFELKDNTYNQPDDLKDDGIKLEYKFYDRYGIDYVVIKKNSTLYSLIKSYYKFQNKKNEFEIIFPWASKEEVDSQISLLRLSNEEYNHRKRIIDKYKIKFCYHITHKNNIKSIIDNGLLSDRLLRNSSLNFANIANLDVKNRREKNEPIYNRPILDYVPLYFTPKTPMLFAKQELNSDLVVIVIHPFILFENGLLFTDGNASSSNSKFFSELNDLKYLDWNCIRSKYWTNFEDGKRKRCSEVLVQGRIDVNYFYKIVCNNKRLYDELLNDYSETNILIDLDYKYFF